ncbi:MAG: type II secretion system protein [Kiritimatiellae bacterium]|nr:type II secretion system protein [Kiritimatiellia bacterium]MDD5523402.1 type II secretion system protein [Kiritimatiellia bacterium]
MKASTLLNTNGKGFTLLELMVVITIISILAALLFPVFKRMQESANRVACMNNLSQIYKSMVMYSMDNQDVYPSNFVAMAKYLQEGEMLKCRSDKWRIIASAISNLTSATADQFCSYNLMIKATDRSPITPTSASALVLACDKDGNNNNVTRNGFGKNHGEEGGNVLYNNGSVRWMNTETWVTNTLGGSDLNTVVGY